jgi:hypothetical protein
MITGMMDNVLARKNYVVLVMEDLLDTEVVMVILDNLLVVL